MNHTHTGTSHDQEYERDGVPVEPPVRCHVGTEHRLEFELHGVPAAILSHSESTRYLGTTATVTVTVAGTAPPTVQQVDVKGVRASKHDDAPTRQTVKARYTMMNSGLWPDPPAYVLELAADALAIIARQDGGVQ